MKKILLMTTCIIFMSGCARNNGQTQYMAGEAGQAVNVKIATIIAVKKIKIQQKPTGAGAVGGLTGGAIAGAQLGKGDGQLATAIGGMIVGALIGAAIENEIQNEEGYQYTLRVNGTTKIIVQNKSEGDVVFKKNDKVLLQTEGSYQRILPIE